VSEPCAGVVLDEADELLAFLNDEAIEYPESVSARSELRLALELRFGRRCRICGDQERAVVLDHCHETNIVRGLICGLCNSALGLFRDDPDLMRRAAEYVERFF